MASMSPLRRRMIEDMKIRNLSPATQRSYLAAVLKLSRYFGPIPRLSRTGGYPRLPGPLGSDRDILAGAQPDRLCAALFLRCDARP